MTHSGASMHVPSTSAAHTHARTYTRTRRASLRHLEQVLAPKAIDSTSLLQRFKIIKGYGAAVQSLVGDIISIELLAQLLGPAIYFWSRSLSIPCADIKTEWVCAYASAGKRSSDFDSEAEGGRGSSKRAKNGDDGGADAGRKRQLSMGDVSEDGVEGSEMFGGKRCVA